MMSFLIFLALVATAYFVWRIVDQFPDLVYRLSEIQRDVADLRRQIDTDDFADAHPPVASTSGDDIEGDDESAEGEPK